MPLITAPNTYSAPAIMIKDINKIELMRPLLGRAGLPKTSGLFPAARAAAPAISAAGCGFRRRRTSPRSRSSTLHLQGCRGIAGQPAPHSRVENAVNFRELIREAARKLRAIRRRGARRPRAALPKRTRAFRGPPCRALQQARFGLADLRAKIVKARLSGGRDLDEHGPARRDLYQRGFVITG